MLNIYGLNFVNYSVSA